MPTTLAKRTMTEPFPGVAPLVTAAADYDVGLSESAFTRRALESPPR